ncbi:EpsG family protein [Priestia megaterium]|uniref:EpsG family protein n=1 Tax=Priestia megaterium TaxID=1404 RepID=UPI002D7F6BB2|nr:EpsG family protein [Priestia megaterium]MEB4860652.1 EpsG family protein [Priestia megaterium]
MILIFYVSIALVMLISLGKRNHLINNIYFNNYVMLMMVLTIAMAIGMRDITFGTDSFAYSNTFLGLKQFSLIEALKAQIYEPLFIIWQWILGRFFSSPHTFFMINFLFFSGILIIGLRKIVNKRFVLFIFFGYVSLSFFGNMITNIIRQGLSISLIILAVCLYINKEKKDIFFFLVLICASLFHYSTVPVALLLTFINIKNIKVKNLLLIWFALFIAFLLKIQNVFSPFVNNPIISSYMSDYALRNYGGGIYRKDFLIFSLVWLLLGLFLYKKFKFNLKYSLILKFYIISNLYFLIFGFLPFSERFAIYSWSLIPLLVWYPLSLIEKSRPLIIFGICLISLIIAIVTDSFYYLSK